MTPLRATKLIVLLVAILLHATMMMMMVRADEPSCTRQEAKYNDCIVANLALCEEGCSTGGPAAKSVGVVEEQQLTTEDVLCGFLQGMLCVVHHCCQHTCAKEIKNYFECLTQNMESCDLVCMDGENDDSSSSDPVGLSMLVLALVFAWSIAMHLYNY